MFDVSEYGAKGDGSTNDLAALQAAVNAADSAGGGTVRIPPGSYFIGSDTWKIGEAATQNHVNIQTDGPVVTRIISTASNNPAIYFNLEKYVTVSGGFYLQGQKTGIGISLGGDSGTGMETNSAVLNSLIVEGFDQGIVTEGGIGTSADLTFNNLTLNNNNIGFHNSNPNGLDFVFNMLKLNNNGTGIRSAVGDFKVFGGSGHGNVTDFDVVGSTDAAVVITGFRSECPGLFLKCTGNVGAITLLGVVVTGLATPNAQQAIYNAGCRLTVIGSKIGGQIEWLPGGFGTLYLQGNIIVDPDNTWTVAQPVKRQGPGFRLGSGGAPVDARWVSQNNTQAKNNADTIWGQWPNAQGTVSLVGGDSTAVVQ